MGWGPFPPFLRDDHLTQAQRADAVRWFLELNGFIMNFAELTSPLTNLTRKCESDLVHWQSSAKEALNSIWLGKINSLGITMLHSPNFSLRAGGRFVFVGEGIRLRYTSVVSCQSARLNTAQQIKNVWQFCRQLKPSTVISWYADSPYVRAMFCWLHCTKDANTQIIQRYLAWQPFKFTMIQRLLRYRWLWLISSSVGKGSLGRMAPHPRLGDWGIWWRGVVLAQRRESWSRGLFGLAGTAVSNCLIMSLLFMQ